MARRYKPKNEINTARFFDFSGGVRYDKDPDSLPENALQKAENVEFDNISGSLKTVDGFEALYDLHRSVDYIYYDPVHDELLYVNVIGSTASLYRASTNSLIGTLTGVSPSFVPFCGKLIIASGGQLQSYDGSTLSLVKASYNYLSWQASHAYTTGAYVVKIGDDTVAYTCVTAGTSAASEPVWGDATVNDGTVVWAKIDFTPAANIAIEVEGRLVISLKGQDRVWVSGVQDYTNWQFDENEMNACWVDIAPQDSMDITEINVLSKDIVVFKSNAQRTIKKILRIVGSFPDVTVSEVNRSFDCINKKCSVQANNNLYFLSSIGFQGLQTVQEYGDIQQIPPGIFVNMALAKNIDENAKIWHVPYKNQIWIKCANNSIIWIFHYATGAFTTRKMASDQLNDVTFDATTSYFSIGSKIYKLNPTLSTELGDFDIYGDLTDIYGDTTEIYNVWPIVSEIITRRVMADRDMLIKEIRFVPNPDITGAGHLYLGAIDMPINSVVAGTIAENNELIYLADEFINDGTEAYVNKQRFNYRFPYVELRLKFTEGVFGMRGAIVQYAEVGT